MFGIFASIIVKPEHRERFLATMEETARRSVREEAGCVRFDVFRVKGAENRYLLYEVYVDEAAFEAHLTTPHARRAMEGAKAWGAGPFDVTRAESIYPSSSSAFDTLMDDG